MSGTAGRSTGGAERTSRGKFRYITRKWARYLVANPKGVRWLWPYFTSLSARPLSSERPWMAFEAIAGLEELLRPEDLLFEYGSGGSTLFFARRVAKVVSVEHETSFCSVVSRRLAEEGIENVEYHCVPPEPDRSAAAGDPGRFGSTNAACRRMSFERYVTVLDSREEGSFDWIVVDGRARVDCVRHAMAPLRPGGVLVLDNSNRPQYAPAIDLLEGWKASHYYGPVFGDYVFSRTSFFRKPPA